MGRDKGMTTGRQLYFELLERGYKTVELSQKLVGRYVAHLAHATQAVNPQEFTLRNHTVAKYQRQMKKVMNSLVFQKILIDESLDT
jgi:hypothetical protein